MQTLSAATAIHPITHSTSQYGDASRSVTTDIFGNPAVQNHLTDWGFWLWTGFILLLLFAAALLVLSALFIRDATSSIPLLIAFATTVGYFLVMYSVMRHIPGRGAVWLIAIAATIFLSIAISKLGGGGIGAYAILAVANIAPAMLDGLARHLAGIPVGWATVVILGAGVAVVGLGQAFRR